MVLRPHFPVHRVQWMLKCSNVMNPFLHIRHPAPLLARYLVITGPLNSVPAELRHLPEPKPTGETHHPYKPPAAFSCSFHTRCSISTDNLKDKSQRLLLTAELPECPPGRAMSRSVSQHLTLGWSPLGRCRLLPRVLCAIGGGHGLTTALGHFLPYFCIRV